MANRRIRVSYGRTIQDRPYHSIHLDILDDEDIKDKIDKTVNGLSSYAHIKIAEIAK